MQALEAESLPVVEFPQSPSRMTPATTRMFEAVVNGTLTHSGDGRLARHVGNCVLRIDSRGSRLAKEHKHRPGGSTWRWPRSWPTPARPSWRRNQPTTC